MRTGNLASATSHCINRHVHANTPAMHTHTQVPPFNTSMLVPEPRSRDLPLNLQTLLPTYPPSQGLPKALAATHVSKQKSEWEHQGGFPSRPHLLLR